jgi:hypothetical protein
MSLRPPFTGTGLNSAAAGLISSATNLSGFGSTILGGFSGNQPPTANGNGPRANQIPPLKGANTTRQIMKWLVPEQPIISMYVNPKNVRYDNTKDIRSTRVKGGYALQYFGESLSKLTISGTTGTSGIEGINVLNDIYRNEQLMFDPYALTLAAQRDRMEQSSFDQLLFGQDGPLGLNGGTLGDIASITTSIMNGGRSTNIVNSRTKPTLASLAFTVELYWSGEVYRGYFENFNVTEDAGNLGLFDYTMSFVVTQKRGYRRNFMPWHKNPNLGPSNWEDGGRRLSYGYLMDSPSGVPNQNKPYIYDDVESGSGKIVNNLNGRIGEGNGSLSSFWLP